METIGKENRKLKKEGRNRLCLDKAMLRHVFCHYLELEMGKKVKCLICKETSVHDKKRRDALMQNGQKVIRR